MSGSKRGGVLRRRLRERGPVLLRFYVVVLIASFVLAFWLEKL